MRWTAPNILTVLRLLAAPMLGIVFLILPRPAADWVALFLFIFASLTDYIDGWLARKWAQISRFGAMLDPIADKAMVVIALAVLLGLHGISDWTLIPIAAILFREVFVSGLQGIPGRDGRASEGHAAGEMEDGGADGGHFAALRLGPVRSLFHHADARHVARYRGRHPVGRDRGQRRAVVEIPRPDRGVLRRVDPAVAGGGAYADHRVGLFSQGDAIPQGNAMKLDIHYFAWLRERLGTGHETVETEADTVAELIEELRARDEGYAYAFSDTGAIRAAVDQELVEFDAGLGGAREVAFFPPMTGG
jgi:molybdopterin converting factor subunit 1